MIYLDNAASTRLDDEVLSEMTPYLTENYGNAQAQHSAGRASANAISSARDKIAAVARRKKYISFRAEPKPPTPL